uniref:Uncharacterized protein n=1 Tax=Arundo donax TaxID=35708 RepID=A0A0A9C280_ARUDO
MHEQFMFYIPPIYKYFIRSVPVSYLFIFFGHGYAMFSAYRCFIASDNTFKFFLNA